MPEGHTVHRLARTFDELFLGEQLEVSSPQGRFAAGARAVDGHRLVASEAWGKHTFLGFRAPGAGLDDPVAWLRVHLGLYGAWTFDGDGTAEVAHAIGAPRRRIGERDSLPAGPAWAVDPSAWVPPAPRGQVRARLIGAHAVADLTGPTACEVVTDADKRAVEARLGPDPIRTDGDREAERDRFVDRVRRSRTVVGTQLMDQAVVSGVGNIYRAEVLFRAGLDPLRPGTTVPAEVLRDVWDDLTVLMRDGATTGAIVTTRPEDRGPVAASASRHVVDGPRRRVRQNTDVAPGSVAADDSFYVYHRDGSPCRVCGTTVTVQDLAGRTLYRCPTCQV